MYNNVLTIQNSMTNYLFVDVINMSHMVICISIYKRTYQTQVMFIAIHSKNSVSQLAGQ